MNNQMSWTGSGEMTQNDSLSLSLIQILWFRFFICAAHNGSFRLIMVPVWEAGLCSKQPNKNMKNTWVETVRAKQALLTLAWRQSTSECHGRSQTHDALMLKNSAYNSFCPNRVQSMPCWSRIKNIFMCYFSAKNDLLTSGKTIDFLWLLTKPLEVWLWNYWRSANVLKSKVFSGLLPKVICLNLKRGMKKELLLRF